MRGVRMATLLAIVFVVQASAQEGWSVRARALSLMDRRVESPEAWRELIREGDLDRQLFVLSCLARVGSPRLREVVEETGVLLAWMSYDQGWRRFPDVLRLRALARGESRRVASGDTTGGFTLELPALVDPKGALDGPAGARWTDDARRLGDPWTARFTYGWRLKDVSYLDEARRRLDDAPAAPAPVRQAAVRYLMRRGTSLDRERLEGLLADAEPQVAALAARGLGRLAAAESVGPLVAAFLAREARSPRVQILRALGGIPDRGGLPAFLSALGSGDAHLQRTALEALARWLPRVDLADRDRRGLAAFLWAVFDKDPQIDVRAAAAAPLAVLAPRVFAEEARKGRFARPWAQRVAMAGVVGKWDPGRDRSLGALFAGDPDRRVVAAYWEGVASGESSHRRERLLSLAAAATDEVIVSIALDGLVKGPAPWTPTEREKAWRVLERAREVLPPSQAEARQALIRLAKVLGGERAMGFVERMAREEPEIALRRLAVHTLASMGQPHHPAFRPRAEDRARAREALALIAAAHHPRVRIETSRGVMVVELYPREAPFTVLAFLRRVRERFYDGLLFHRVVPDFVAQAGCPRGDGWGGPPDSLRCEVNTLTYRRGTLGMALAGRDTGGSQWFLCLSPQPHLDGRYTIFGDLVEGFDVLDALVQGDVIHVMKVL